LKDNYHKILGLTSNASEGDVKKAYRKLAMLYHPDRNQNVKAHEKFIKINEAYAALTDDNYTAKTIKEEVDLKTKNNLSTEELEKRMEWAQNYSRMKDIKESRINYISFIQLRNSPMRWISLYISIISVFFSSLLVLDYWLIPYNTIEGSVVSKEFNSNTNLYKLTFNNLDESDSHEEFVFKTDIDQLRQINKIIENSNKNNKFNFYRTNIFNQLLTINCFSGDQVVLFYNKGSFFEMIFLFVFIFSLPIITLISWGPNTIHILSSYLVTYLAIFGFFILLIVLFQ
tara:strand:+ start:282 stop:1139 length:858 start_codon:yes stop_codon:yes gene_type:complete